MDAQKLKEKAAEAFGKGRFGKAAELYSEYCEKDPRDLQARVRTGDAWSRGGKKEKAIAAYQSAAEGFAKEGFLPRAIAAAKLILELDPKHTAVQKMLADLYARRNVPASEGKQLPGGSIPAREPSRAAGPGDPWKHRPTGVEKRGIELPQEPPEEEGFQLQRTAADEPQTWSGDRGIEINSPRASKPKHSGELPKTPERAPGSPVGRGASPVDVADDSDDLDLMVDPSSSEDEPFTELEIEGDSLLHAVERAAKLGIAQRSSGEIASPASSEEREAAVPAVGRRKVPRVPLFSDLAPDAFIELFERGPLLRLKKAERVFEQGSVGDSFFVVCSGSVRVVRQEGGAEKELAALDEGSFFGEMAILSESPRTASVVSASDDTVLLEISAQLLSQLSQRHPPVAQALKKFCRQRLLANVMSGSALFRPFTANERRALVERFRAREVTQHAVIVREGERSDGMYVVLSGEVQVAKNGRNLAVLREGEIFGEMSLLTKTLATATVTATRRTSLLRLPRQDFDELIMSHPQILVLVSELSDDRRRLTDAANRGSAIAGKRKDILV